MKGRKQTMANFVLSAFADEVSPVFDEQLKYLKKQNIDYIEPRNIDGTNVSSLTLEQAKEAKAKMDKNGIGVSSIGSPIGKINVVTDDFDEHFKLFEHTLDIADIFEAKNIRMFSFFYPKGEDCHKYRDVIFSHIEKMLALAEKRHITLCHENEMSIYGEKPEDCYDIMQHFGGRLKSVFDNGNFAFCFTEAYPKAFNLLKTYIEYIHIKDAKADGAIVPAGQGVGHIKEVLSGMKDVDRDIFLTLEPHLTVFSGLDKLSNLAEIKVQNAFETPEAAFDAAVSALRAILAEI